MGYWSFYFLLKLGLYWTAVIGFHWWQNLALAMFVLLPAKGKTRVVKQLIAIPAGIALLYYDSFLPPFSRIISQFSELSQFDTVYLFELASRFIALQSIVALLVAFLLYWLLSCKLRMTSFAVIGILLVPLTDSRTSSGIATAEPQQVASTAANPAPTLEPSGMLTEFYREERLRQTPFSPPLNGQKDFDIVVLQICSLSWDDLNLFEQTQHPLLQRSDFLFTAFNTAASYSGPAAIRMLRASCGQQPHNDLYAPANSRCLLFEELSNQGFKTELMLNHTGDFGGFLNQIRRLGGISAPLRSFAPAPQTMRQFDGDPIYSDAALLDNWIKARKSAGGTPAALFYNSTSLHDGNRLLDQPKVSSTKSYPLRLKQLLDDIYNYLENLDKAGRNTIVLLVPEHGSAIRGDDKQISGLREIPTPAITLAPAAVFLAGNNRKPQNLRITEPVSYLAISELLARFVRQDPFTTEAPGLDQYIVDLPRTRFVAENDGIVVMHNGSSYIQRDSNGRWESLNIGLGRADR